MFLALSGHVVMDPVQISDPLDITSTLPANPMRLSDPSCLTGSGSGVRD
jgi:hypothetical protein